MKKVLMGLFLLSCLQLPEAQALSIVHPGIGVEPVRPLVFHKGIKCSEVESHWGRKMTGGERLAFSLNKRRFIEVFVNKAEGEKGTDGFAIAGFVSSLFFPVVGIVLSAIGLGRVKKNGKKGKGLATAGLVIGIVTTALFFLL
jgi:hypothetical protein